MARDSRRNRYLKLKKLVGRAERYWRPRHEAMHQKVRFLIDGLHFEDDEFEQQGSHSSEITWRGQESFNVWRHEVAFVTDSPTSIVARPLDAHGADPALQEEAIANVQSEWELPGKEYEDCCEDMAGSASAAGFGAWMLDIQGEARSLELVPLSLRFDQVMWDPAVKSPLSRRCRWVIVRLRMVRSEALAKCSAPRAPWRASIVSKLESDDGYSEAYFDTKTNPVPQTGDTESESEWSEDDELTFYVVWERLCAETKEQDSEEEDGFELFPDGLRYMACSCGYRSPRQGSLSDGKEYPETMVCPDCGKLAERIDGTQKIDRVIEYPDGRMSVLAPFGGVDDFVYEGEWEVECRNYPIVFLSRFRHPLRPYGPSLADLNRANQLAVDIVMRTMLERLAISASYWMLPGDAGLEDAWGQPWQFSDENGFAMYYKGQTAPSVQLLEGSGVPQAGPSVYSIARSALVDKTGIADFGLGPGQSRDIPASSVAQQIQQQEIPTAHYKRRFQRAKGYARDLVYDYLRALYPDERPVRTRGTDGREHVVMSRPSSLPNFQFYESDAPDFKALTQDKQAAFTTVMSLVEKAPWALSAAESAYHLPHSLIQQMKDDYQSWKDQAMPSVTPRPGVPGPGAPMPAPNGGANGARPELPSALAARLFGMLGARPQPTAGGMG